MFLLTSTEDQPKEISQTVHGPGQEGPADDYNCPDLQLYTFSKHVQAFFFFINVIIYSLGFIIFLYVASGTTMCHYIILCCIMNIKLLLDRNRTL